jgi:hypothetical protein
MNEPNGKREQRPQRPVRMAETSNSYEGEKQDRDPNQQERPPPSPLARVGAIRRPRYFLKILKPICVLDFH